MDESCLFCKIAAGKIPAKLAYQDDQVVAFHDIAPQAPTHVLVIPRAHVVSLAHTEASQEPLLGRLLSTAVRVAAELGLAESGYRTVVNTGKNGGQSVYHLHVHVLGGRPLGWPPG